MLYSTYIIPLYTCKLRDGDMLKDGVGVCGGVADGVNAALITSVAKRIRDGGRAYTSASEEDLKRAGF